MNRMSVPKLIMVDIRMTGRKTAQFDGRSKIVVTMTRGQLLNRVMRRRSGVVVCARLMAWECHTGMRRWVHHVIAIPLRWWWVVHWVLWVVGDGAVVRYRHWSAVLGVMRRWGHKVAIISCRGAGSAGCIASSDRESSEHLGSRAIVENGSKIRCHSVLCSEIDTSLEGYPI